MTRLSPAVRIVLATALVVALGAGIWWYVASTRFDPLAPSRSAEVALRVARLAGFERAVAGGTGARAFVRLELPAVSSAADIEIAWQIGAAALASAYPRAGSVVVQIYADSRPLLEASGDGGKVREAVAADDADALRDAFAFRLLRPVLEVPATLESSLVPQDAARAAAILGESAPANATDVPANALAVDIDVPGAYLDAKNEAAGLLGSAGPSTADAAALAAEAEAMRAAVPGIPAIPGGTDVTAFWAGRIRELSDAAGGIDGVDEVFAALGTLDSPESARSLAMAAQAVTVDSSFGSVLAGTASAADAVAETPLDPGAPSDAVLAAVDDEAAAQEATVVTRFERDRAADASGTAPADSLPGRIFRATAGAGSNRRTLTYAGDDDTPRQVSPDVWEAYRRADGTVFWLAPDNGVALTDLSVRGWAFSLERAGLVDASRVGRILAYYRAG